MKLQRTARLHQAGTDPVLWWEFMPGDRVKVVEGFLGTVVAVEDGPGAGLEQYVIELDAGMGGGDYSAEELTAVEGTGRAAARQANSANPGAYSGQPMVPPAVGTEDDDPQAGQALQQMQTPPEAEDSNSYSDQNNPYMAVASDDYPMLSEILLERPPLAHSERVAKTASHWYSHEIGQNPEGKWFWVTHVLTYHPDENAGEDPEWDAQYDETQVNWWGGPFDTWSAAVRNMSDTLGNAGSYDGGDDYPNPFPPEILAQMTPDKKQPARGRNLPYFWTGSKTDPVPVRIRRAAGYIVEDEDGQVVAGPFVSRLDAEAAERQARGEGQTNIVIRRQGMAKGETKPFKDTWWLERFLVPLAEDMIARQPEHLRYDPATGKGPSYDWCRFRRTRRCFYPRQLNEAASDEAGYAVWVPEDRGFCPRDPWEGEMGQMSCPVSEPGPHAKPPYRALADATIAWEDGGQRYDANGNPKAASLSTSAAGDDGWYRSAVSSGDAYGRITGRNHYWKDGLPICGATSRGIPPRRGEKVTINYNNCGACAKRVEKERLV